MKLTPKGIAIALLIASVPSATFAEAPVRRIEVFISPYYQSAASPKGKPAVEVGKDFDKLLQSNKPKDILAARDRAIAMAERVSPVTLMVLAVRLYDVGLRDDAVLWFYIAKNRAMTLFDVMDTGGAGPFGGSPFGGAPQALASFVELAGPDINGYAFCDLKKQRVAAAKAVTWVEEHPYAILTVDQLPAKPGDRQENLKRSIEKMKAGLAEQDAFFADPENLKKFNADRMKYKAAEKYCWQTPA
jgi:hypothetical protein